MLLIKYPVEATLMKTIGGWVRCWLGSTLFISGSPDEDVDADCVGQDADLELVDDVVVVDAVVVVVERVVVVRLQDGLAGGEQHLDEALHLLQERGWQIWKRRDPMTN